MQNILIKNTQNNLDILKYFLNTTSEFGFQTSKNQIF